MIQSYLVYSRFFWLYVLDMWFTRSRVNPHYSCLNVKELLAQSRHEIWSLSDCNWTQTHNHLVRKRTLNYLAKLAQLIELKEVKKGKVGWKFMRQFLKCLKVPEVIFVTLTDN